MTNQQLSNYVRQQLQQGKSKEEIKTELLGAGWQETDINQALDIFGPPQPPRPLSASSFTPTGLQQLDPKAIWLFFISFVLRSFAPIIVLSIWGLALLGDIGENLDNGGKFSFGFLNWLWIIIPAFLVLCFVWAKLTHRFYRYELTDAGFRKELGVIYKKYATVPYDRIQNVDIHRGIIARILGLSDLNIQTAGASAVAGRHGVGSEGRLPALSRETAEQLRDELIQRARQSKNQGF